MKRGILALALAAGLLPGVALAGQPRAVLELFTSQGCSSCPPADKIAGALASDPSIVILSLPVDYWDYLGWKDTLAKPAFTARQKAYASARGDRNIYTPQVVVNGLAHVVGSDRAALEVAIEETRQEKGVLVAPVTIDAADDGYIVTVDAAPGQSGEVWLIATRSSAEVAIGRGENSGHSIDYTNVARAITKIADFGGDKQSFRVARAATTVDGADGFAVLVQARHDGKPGAILGAAAHSAHRRLAQP